MTCTFFNCKKKKNTTFVFGFSCENIADAAFNAFTLNVQYFLQPFFKFWQPPSKCRSRKSRHWYFFAFFWGPHIFCEIYPERLLLTTSLLQCCLFCFNLVDTKSSCSFSIMLLPVPFLFNFFTSKAESVVNYFSNEHFHNFITLRSIRRWACMSMYVSLFVATFKALWLSFSDCVCFKLVKT